jgi:hypothetical protein
MKLQGRRWWVSMCDCESAPVVSLNHHYGLTMCCPFRYSPVHVGLAFIHWVP